MRSEFWGHGISIQMKVEETKTRLPIDLGEVPKCSATEEKVWLAELGIMH